MYIKYLKALLSIIPVFFCIFVIPAAAENSIELAEENREFWNDLMEDSNIQNKNLLYASYVAYQDSLNDLSIESFQECIDQNRDNERILGISHYYIGKNWYKLGDFQKALNHFLAVPRYDLGGFPKIKYANYINLALTLHQMEQNNKARIYLQKVKEENSPPEYQKMADTILLQMN